MNASNIFKIFVRTLMIVFLIAFMINITYSAQSKEDYKDKTSKLQLENSSSTLTSWFALDQTHAKTHLKSGLKYFNESKNDEFKNEMKIAKLLVAEEKQSSLYLEVEKAEKAFENVLVLKKKLEEAPKLNHKFVRLISKNNTPMIVGHVVSEKDDTVSIRDQDGFIIPIHRNNISSMNEVDGKEKEKIYNELLAKIMEDNGKTSSYGLYLSAKWAQENDLQEKVNSILIDAAMNDSQIIMTIADNEARKFLSVAKWSNLVGDYEIAKENAQMVINSYANTPQLKEAEETLQDILKNIEKEKRILNSISDKKPADTATASIPKETFVEPPEVKNIAEELEPVVAVTPKNTLKIKSKTNDEINKGAITPNKPEVPEEIIEEKTAGKNDIKNPPIKNALGQDKAFQDAVILVEEGKKFMKTAIAFDNPGNKNAQVNFKKALAKFDAAKNILARISSKYPGNTDLDELATSATQMHFFIAKSCLRL